MDDLQDANEKEKKVDLLKGETEQSSDNTDADLERGQSSSSFHNSSEALWLGNVAGTRDGPIGNLVPDPAKRRVSFSGDSPTNTRTTKTPLLNTVSHKSSPRKIVIREGAAPSKQLMLRMIDLQGELELVNQRVMSGLVVSKDDWETVRQLTGRLEHIFGNAEFEWEQKHSDKDENTSLHKQVD